VIVATQRHVEGEKPECLLGMPFNGWAFLHSLLSSGRAPSESVSQSSPTEARDGRPDDVTEPSSRARRKQYEYKATKAIAYTLNMDCGPWAMTEDTELLHATVRGPIRDVVIRASEVPRSIHTTVANKTRS
jgi:hypothetical protein